MSDPKNHHYLPVFFLARWCDSTAKVFRYYRPYRQVVATPIAPSNTGYEPFLYSHQGVAADRIQALETEFMTPHVDTPASEAIKVFLAGRPELLTEQLKSAWTRFLIAMRIRNPAALAEVTALTQAALKEQLSSPDKEYDETKEPGDPATLYEWVEQHAPHIIGNIGKTYLPSMIEHEETADHIINMHWGTIDVSSGGVSLLVGDVPFVATDGLKEPNCVVALPISPWRAFIATNRHAASELLRKGPAGFACALNEHTVQQAIRHVYGQSDRHLLFVERRLKMVSNSG